MADSIIITANVTDGAIINSNVTESTAVTANVVTGAKGDKGDTGATGAAGVVQAVTDGTGIDVDATDPASPIVSLDPASIASLALADSAIQSLSDLSITSTAAELNYTDGVTSAIQTQLDGKSATSHTHTAADTTDFDTEVSNNTDVAANTAARHTHANSAVLDATTASFTTADETKLDGIAAGAQVNTVTSVAGKTGAVTLDKADVGLSNVDNTSDANKPVSTAQQTALNAKANASDTVNLTGNQTVAGVKTFSSSPVVPTATTSTQAVNKGQMDTADALKVNKAGDTMTGRLASQSTILGFAQSRAGKNITFGASSNGDFQAYNDTDGNNIYAAYSDGTGLSFSSSGTQIRYGTGFPEGIVTAPVGSIYIDKAVTNGASSWIKKSGTGNTGWVVLEGYTRRRIPNTDLLNGWTSIGGTPDDTINLVRDGNLVTICFPAIIGPNGVSATSNLFYLLPLGFRLGTNGNYGFISALRKGGTLVSLCKDFNNLDAPMGSGVIEGVVSWPTNDAWPTTLPGTAA